MCKSDICNKATERTTLANEPGKKLSYMYVLVFSFRYWMLLLQVCFDWLHSVNWIWILLIL